MEHLYISEFLGNTLKLKTLLWQNLIYLNLNSDSHISFTKKAIQVKCLLEKDTVLVSAGETRLFRNYTGRLLNAIILDKSR